MQLNYADLAPTAPPDPLSAVATALRAVADAIEAMPREAPAARPDHRIHLRAKEAAETLGICRTMLEELTAAGELRCVRAGRRVVWRLDELDAYSRRMDDEQNGGRR